jgi:hypothetical protein
MAIKKLPEVAFIRECVDYNPDTGIFTWRARPSHHFPDGYQTRINTRQAGKPAGSLLKGCYWQIKLGRSVYKAHRLAWLLMYGEPVPDTIDHIDGNGLNNRIDNLRAATKAESSQNRGSATGMIGITYHTDSPIRPFEVRVAALGKRHRIGCFATIDEAKAARREAAERLHGQFARHD